MLQQTVSMWRRLVGKGDSPAEADPSATEGDPEADRRLWVRYPADLNALVKAAGNQDTRLSASVRDVSQGGACLLLDRPFQPGQLLSLELPRVSDNSVHTILACVVRSNPEGAGRWNVGCVFARELADEDLECFGARRVPQPAPDQRTWMRFPCNVKAAFQKIGEAENPPGPARVLNLSASGIGLMVKEEVETGALLSLDLAGQKANRTILACVVHATAHTSGEWSIGCNFIRELSEEDLQALLA